MQTVSSHIVHLLVVAITSTLVTGGSARADSPVDQAIVRMRAGFDIEDFNADFGTVVLDEIPGHDTYLLQLPPGWLEDAFELAAEADPRVAEAEANEIADAPGGHTQSFYFHIAPIAFTGQYTWGLIDLPAAQASATGAGVTVAVLDTGIDASHPVFGSTTVRVGFDFVSGVSGAPDVGDGLDSDADGFVDELVGHGTFVAGIIVGMAPDATILPIRVLDGDGVGEVFRVAAGIYHAVDDGADVINLSLGMLAENEALKDALEYAREADVVVVAAAGNANQHEPVVFPAALSTALGVASTDAEDHKSPFSNYGGYVDLCAPGTSVVSAVPGAEFGSVDGTSASSALVAGCVALVRAANPSLTPPEVEFIVIQSAVSVETVNPAYAGQLGAGRLDAAAAVADAIAYVPLAGDLNEDLVVNVGDLLLMMGVWGAVDTDADLDGDGIVGVGDLLVLLSNWG